MPYMFALETAMDELAVKLGDRSGRASSYQRHGEGSGQGRAIHVALAHAVFRCGGEAVPMVAAQSRARVDVRRRVAGRAMAARRLRTRPTLPPAPRASRCARRPCARGHRGARARHGHVHHARDRCRRQSSACRSRRSTSASATATCRRPDCRRIESRVEHLPRRGARMRIDPRSHRRRRGERRWRVRGHRCRQPAPR